MLAGWDKLPLSTATIDRAEHVIKTAVDQGITLFDHAAEATPQAGKLVRALADLSRVKGVATSASWPENPCPPTIKIYYTHIIFWSNQY